MNRPLRITQKVFSSGNSYFTLNHRLLDFTITIQDKYNHPAWTGDQDKDTKVSSFIKKFKGSKISNNRTLGT